jgi:uncharacterized protein YkwD
MTDPRRRCQYRALAWLLTLSPLCAGADVLDSVNGVRSSGCAGGVKAQPLQPNTRLDEVARRLAGGASLHTAQQQAGYRALSAFSVNIADVPADGDVRHIIERQFCPQATNPAFRELGIYRQGNDVWLAFAAPVPGPTQLDPAAQSARMLQAVNAARATAHRCGNGTYPPAAPLTRDGTLERVAQDYAEDMATFGYMDHTGRDGSVPHERITRSGYRWSETGENLASGLADADSVVAGWLRSPEHCANIMEPAYTQMGAGVAVNPRNDAAVYWALEFGRPAGR